MLSFSKMFFLFYTEIVTSPSLRLLLQGVEEYAVCIIWPSKPFILSKQHPHMDDDDFLWQCALQEKACDSTHFLVPGVLDEPKKFLTSHKQSEPLSFSAVLPRRFDDLVGDLEISVGVIEIRGNGVLDTIGGEIWEASLLLCAYILLYPNQFIHNSVLELGSGLGLPGLLIAELRSFVRSSTEREICLSDNDPRCVENLADLIHRRYGGAVDEDDIAIEVTRSQTLDNCSSLKNCVSVVDLDWTSYISSVSSSVTTDTCTAHGSSLSLTGNALENAVERESMLDGQRFQYIIGSALCYSPYHVCLADTVLHFLDGACEEVIIIQIGDRAGFSLFLDRLNFFQISYSIEDVPEIVYSCAQSIGETQSVNVDNDRLHSAYANFDEGEIRLEKTFFFPNNLIRNAISESRDSSECVCNIDESVLFSDHIGSNNSEINSKIKNNLIRTDRELFKLVRAKAIRRDIIQ